MSVINIKTLGAKGDGVTNDRALIQKCFDECNNGDTIYFPEGIYLVDLEDAIDKYFDTLTLRDKRDVVLSFAAHATIKQKLHPGSYDESLKRWVVGYNVLSLINCSDCIIINGKIKGEASERGAEYVSRLSDKTITGAHSALIKLSSCKKCTVDSVELFDSYGDGISICRQNASYDNCDNIIIKGSDIHNCIRNGITVASGNNVKILDNHIHHIVGGMPQAGIDVEVERKYGYADNIRIARNKFDNCASFCIVYEQSGALPGYLYNGKFYYKDNMSSGQLPLNYNRRYYALNQNNKMYEYSSNQFIVAQDQSMPLRSRIEIEDNTTDLIHIGESTSYNSIIDYKLKGNKVKVLRIHGKGEIDSCEIAQLQLYDTESLVVKNSKINPFIFGDTESKASTITYGTQGLTIPSVKFENCEIVQAEKNLSGHAFTQAQGKVTYLEFNKCIIKPRGYSGGSVLASNVKELVMKNSIVQVTSPTSMNHHMSMLGDSSGIASAKFINVVFKSDITKASERTAMYRMNFNKVTFEGCKFEGKLNSFYKFFMKNEKKGSNTFINCSLGFEKSGLSDGGTVEVKTVEVVTPTEPVVEPVTEPVVQQPTTEPTTPTNTQPTTSTEPAAPVQSNTQTDNREKHSGTIMVSGGHGTTPSTTSIKFDSPPTASYDYDARAGIDGKLKGLTSYSNKSSIFVWGSATLGSVLINGKNLKGGVGYENATEILIKRDGLIVLNSTLKE